MKRYEFIGYLEYYEHLNCTCNGNPRYYGEFRSKGGDCLRAKTASDAQCAYGFLNQRYNYRKITYHYTRSGNAVIDYIDILEEVRSDV